ncbi:MAG: hypothetical protein CMF46_05160 [Legionellales bacterium]|nr:hypothetical protein [Legionellales bacterium]
MVNVSAFMLYGSIGRATGVPSGGGEVSVKIEHNNYVADDFFDMECRVDRSILFESDCSNKMH